jgi:small conductance mechanosensitive channel
MGSRKYDEKHTQSFSHGLSRTVAYLIVLATVVALVSYLFGWSSIEQIPDYLQPYSSILLLINPYLKYIQAVIIFSLGYLVVNSASGMVYSYVRRITEHATAATLRTISRIVGIGVLLALMVSVFNVDPSAALTVGSFGGLVVGFATQTILTHVVAGIFLLISRPFSYGDVITVSSQTGIVKEIKLMHVVLETEDSENDILIPSGTIVTQIIKKRLPHALMKPINTIVTLDSSASEVKKGKDVLFTGKLVEMETSKPIANRTVWILDEDIGRDDTLASGLTGEDGSFAISWTAKKTDVLDNTVEIYARFDGDEKYRSTKSRVFVVTVEGT